MKLSTLSHITEMAKPAQTCAKCGMTGMAKHHYRYNDEWRCKPANLAAFAAKQNGVPIPDVDPPDDDKVDATEVQPPKVAAPSTPKVAKTPKIKGPLTPKEQWLKEQDISQYIETEDGTVDVNADVSITNAILRSQKCPIKFGHIAGDFKWSGSNIISLENFPTSVDGDLYVTYTNIRSLDGAPQKVKSLHLDNNRAIRNDISGIPSVIDGDFSIKNCSVKSTAGWHKHIKRLNGYIDITGNLVEEGLLSLMLIPGLRSIHCTDPTIQGHQALEIINKHLQSEDKDAIAAQEELMDAGLMAFAKTK